MFRHVKKLVDQLFLNTVAKKTFKNSIWIISERVMTLIIGVFVTALVARYFGPENYGQFNYAFAFVALFTAISTLGLESLTVKSLIEKKYEEGTILHTSLILRVIGGILLTVMASFIIRLIEPNDQSLHFIVLVISFIMLTKSLDVIEYWIQSKQKAYVAAIIRMSLYLISSGLKIVLILNNGSLELYAMLYLLDAILIGIALVIAYRKIKEDQTVWKFKFGYAKDVLSKSYFLILSGLMITLYMRVDQVMIGSMFNNRSELGFYSVAVKIAEMWYFIPLAIITSFQPIIMESKHRSIEDYHKSIKLLFTIVFWISIGFSIFISIFSNTIISILYGQAYQKSAEILTISVWAGSFAILGSARSIWLVMENLNKYSLYFAFLGAITNIVLNLFLIPIYGGVGAAIATLISQVAVAIIIPLCFNDTRKISWIMFKSIYPSILWKGDLS
jgi:O-antigen/teichoic acid export membrane protein